MAHKMHITQPQPTKHLVETTDAVVHGDHRLGLHTRTGLPEQIDREDG